MREFFNRYRSLCALRLRDQILANAVVRVSLKSALSAAQFLEPSVCGASSYLLQGGSPTRVPLARGFDLLDREGLTVAVGCQVNDTEVNAKHIVNLLWGWLWHFAYGKQKEATLAIDQIRFTLLRRKQHRLFLTAEIGNFLASTRYPDCDELFISSPSQNPVIVSNRAKRLESVLSVLIELVGVGYFGNTPHHNLSRQVKFASDLLIDLQMQGVLLKRLRRPGKLTDSIASLVRQFKGLPQQFGLFSSRIQFDLRDNFHASEYFTLRRNSQVLKDTRASSAH